MKIHVPARNVYLVISTGGSPGNLSSTVFTLQTMVLKTQLSQQGCLNEDIKGAHPQSSLTQGKMDEPSCTFLPLHNPTEFRSPGCASLGIGGSIYKMGVWAVGCLRLWGFEMSNFEGLFTGRDSHPRSLEPGGKSPKTCTIFAL